jgi:hypothetical protein
MKWDSRVDGEGGSRHDSFVYHYFFFYDSTDQRPLRSSFLETYITDHVSLIAVRRVVARSYSSLDRIRRIPSPRVFICSWFLLVCGSRKILFSHFSYDPFPHRARVLFLGVFNAAFVRMLSFHTILSPLIYFFLIPPHWTRSMFVFWVITVSTTHRGI